MWAVCQQLRCPILPPVTSINDRQLGPEAINRFRAINTLYESVTGESGNGDAIELDSWVFGAYPNEKRTRRPSFTRVAVNINEDNLFDAVLPWADDSTYSTGLMILGMILPLVYGGIHLSAWNFEFPTSVESLLWKLASIGHCRHDTGAFFPSAGLGIPTGTTIETVATYDSPGNPRQPHLLFLRFLYTGKIVHCRRVVC